MAEYKIVASDLDGTLLDSNGELSKENLAAISLLKQCGVLFVPASGRSLAEMPEELREHPDVRYIIHSSGAVVYDKLTEERISFCFSSELAEKIMSLLFSVDCHLTVRHRGQMFASIDKMNEESFKNYKVWEAHADLLRRVGKPISDFKERFLSSEDIEMISVFIGDNDKHLKLKALLSEFSDVNVATACPFNIELTYAKAGKGNALSALAEKLNIPVSETVAVGDSENDLPMIKAAGLGLAVVNASPNIKDQADEVVCSNDENALMYIAKKYFSA